MGTILRVLGKSRKAIAPACLFILFLAAGCTRSGISAQYRAERDLWKLRTVERRMNLTMEENKELIETLRRGYQAILERYPASLAQGGTEEANTILQVRVASATALARYHLSEGDRGAAIDVLWKTRRDLSARDTESAVRIYGDLIQILARGSSPDSLAEVFQDLAARFPAATPEGEPIALVLESPLRLADLRRGEGAAGPAAQAALESALTYYDRVANEWSGKPVEVAALVQRANVLLRMERLAEAEEILERARRLPQGQPFEANILFSLAVLREQGMKDTEGAVGLYRELVRLHPQDPSAAQAEFRIGMAYAGQNRSDSALAVLERVERTYGRNVELAAQARYQSARVLRTSGREGDAIRRFRSVTVDFPRTEAGLQAPFEVAEYYRNRKDSNSERATLREATAEYERIVQDLAGSSRENTPVVVLAMDQLATAWVRLEEWQRAVEVLTKRTEAFPGERRSPLALVQAAAILESRLGDHKGTIDMLQRLVERYPGSPMAQRAQEKITELQAKYGS